MERYACLKDYENCNRTGKTKQVFHHEKVAYLNRFFDESQSYDNHTTKHLIRLCKLT